MRDIELSSMHDTTSREAMRGVWASVRQETDMLSRAVGKATLLLAWLPGKGLRGAASRIQDVRRSEGENLRCSDGRKESPIRQEAKQGDEGEAERISQGQVGERASPFLEGKCRYVPSASPMAQSKLPAYRQVRRVRTKVENTVREHQRSRLHPHPRGLRRAMREVPQCA